MNAPTVTFHEPSAWGSPGGFVPGTYVTHTVELLDDGSVLVQEWFVDNQTQTVKPLGGEHRVWFTLHHRSPSRAWQRRRAHYWTARMEHTNSDHVLFCTDGDETGYKSEALPFWRQVDRRYNGTHLGYMGGIESDCLKAALTAFLGKQPGRWATQHPELPWVRS